MLAGVLILGVLNPALSQGYQALTKSLNLTQQVSNTAQIFLWALVSVALGYATSWLLRKYLPDTQMWMALATAAWLLVGLHASYPYYYSMVQDPSQYPDQGNYRLVIVILGNLVSMVALSFTGWLVLRQSYRRAAYWILWSVVAAGAAYGLFMLSYTYLNTPGTAIGDFTARTPARSPVTPSSIWLPLESPGRFAARAAQPARGSSHRTPEMEELFSLMGFCQSDRVVAAISSPATASRPRCKPRSNIRPGSMRASAV